MFVDLVTKSENVPLDMCENFYKTFFMLNSTVHEIFSANKYENANDS